jgi:hypothetical protein
MPSILVTLLILPMLGSNFQDPSGFSPAALETFLAGLSALFFATLMLSAQPSTSTPRTIDERQPT